MIELTTEVPGPRPGPDVTRPARRSSATDDGVVKAVDGVSFNLERGRTLGIVGESGSGKSVTSLAIMGLHTGKNVQVTGEIRLDGEDLVSASRGARPPAARPQDGDDLPGPAHLAAPVLLGRRTRSSRPTGCTTRSPSRSPASAPSTCSAGSASRNPAVRVDDYPHQFSGGMRQRAMIAMALSCDPGAADRRRADHGAGRDRAGADPGPDRRPAGRVRLRRHHHHPRPGRRGRGLRPDPGHVRGPRRRRKARWPACSASRATPTPGACSARCRVWTSAARRGCIPIPGTPPSLINVPSGCPFHPRCGYQAKVDGDRCTAEVPLLRETGPGHLAACHLSADLKRVPLGGPVAIPVQNGSAPRPRLSRAAADQPAAGDSGADVGHRLIPQAR